MNWSVIESLSDFKEAILLSDKQTVLFFKHSTRCPVSFMALKKFERTWQKNESEIKPYFLDLIKYREISNELAIISGIEHQSPQVLVMQAGTVIYHASHYEIEVSEILTNR